MSAHIITGGTLNPRPPLTGQPQHIFTIKGDHGADSAVFILNDQEVTQWHAALSLAKLRTTSRTATSCLTCGRPTRLLTFGGQCEGCYAEDGQPPREAA